MSPDFDFWDREEPVERKKVEENDDKTRSEHDDLAGIKDLLFRKWSTEGTFVVRSEGDRFIITVGTEDGIYAMIKVPKDIVNSWFITTMKLIGKKEVNEKNLET